MRLFLIIAMLITVVTVAYGTTYEWTDRSGVVNFTDDPENVPPEYRNRIRAREIDVDKQSAPVPASVTPDVSGKKEQFYGGRNESEWRESYRMLRDEQKRIEDGIAEKQKQLAVIHRQRVIYKRSSDRVAYNNLDQEIQNDEARLQTVKEKIQQLDEEATRAGVPFEWRK